jgi:hypothetical protein
MADISYLAADALKDYSVQQLLGARSINQQVAGNRYGYTMGTLGTARGNVVRINKELRGRGIDPKTGAAAAKGDTTGLVEAAIRPLKDAAVDHAVEEATAYVARIVKLYEGKILEEAAPTPKDLPYWHPENKAARARQSALMGLLDSKRAPGDEYKPHAPLYLRRNPAKEQAFVDGARADAAASFEAYVAKLVHKVGEGVTKATVEGTQLWRISYLTVAKGATVERWKTQQIVNYSVLGNAYLQWPTRKVK